MRRPERVVAWAAVVAAHGALWWAWPQPGPGRVRMAAEPPVVTLRLIAQPAPAPLVPQPPAIATRITRSTPSRATSRTQPVRPAEATAADTAVTPIAITAVVEPAASAPDAPQRALDLSATRSAASPTSSTRSPALDDPRSNSPRARIETRIAAVAGTTRLEAERMDDTRTRFRIKGDCFEVHVARNAQIDPWNQGHAPTPKAVKPDC
jgi:hypothetical protein